MVSRTLTTSVLFDIDVDSVDNAFVKSREKTLAAEKKFRDLIWELDQGKDRCTGRPLQHQADSWSDLGDVCHLVARSLAPERKYDPTNAFLMCRRLHIASDARGNYRLKILGDDARQPLTFLMTDKHGRELWRRVG